MILLALISSWWKGFFESTSSYFVEKGYYKNIKELLESISHVKSGEYNLKDLVSFSVNKRGRVEMRILGDTHTVTLANDLHISLGFDKAVFTEKINIARYHSQLNRGRFAFFIYSNLVQPTLVGDTEVPLLDVISIDSRANYQDVVSMDVQNPIYRRVALRNIGDIEIKIASDSGEEIWFDNESNAAKTLIALHFIRPYK